MGLRVHNESSVIDGARQAVDVNRQSSYGDPVENAVREAIVASVLTDLAVTPIDVTHMLLAKKLVRSTKGDTHDTQVDIAGYAEILDRVKVATANGETRRVARSIINHLI